MNYTEPDILARKTVIIAKAKRRLIFLYCLEPAIVYGKGVVFL